MVRCWSRGGYGGGTLSSAKLYDPAAGTWADTGSLSNSRENFSVVLLPNGKVLATGGYNDSSLHYLAELYDPATGTWTAAGLLNTLRSHHTTTLLPNGRVLIAGGANTSGLVSSAELYGSATNGCSSYRATATPQLVNGFVVGATITDGGCGYTNAPQVLILGGGGSGASATAVVSNGVVIGINITSAGIGYTSTPTVFIYSPLGVQIGLVQAVKPSFSDLQIGTNYQLQVSGDLNNWTNQGSVFPATNPSMVYPQYFDVDNWSQLYFRLQVSP